MWTVLHDCSWPDSVSVSTKQNKRNLAKKQSCNLYFKVFMKAVMTLRLCYLLKNASITFELTGKFT